MAFLLSSLNQSQILALCSAWIIKLNVTQQVKDSRTGFFRSSDKDKSYACLKILLTQLFGPNTQNST